jgi:hypothetical protein
MEEQCRLLVADPVVLDEDHRRAAGAVVEQLVDVERGDQAVLEVLQQMVAQQAAGSAGVDEAGECVHEHRARQRAGGVLPSRLVHDVQLVGIEHLPPPAVTSHATSRRPRARRSPSHSLCQPAAGCDAVYGRLRTNAERCDVTTCPL